LALSAVGINPRTGVKQEGGEEHAGENWKAVDGEMEQLDERSPGKECEYEGSETPKRRGSATGRVEASHRLDEEREQTPALSSSERSVDAAQSEDEEELDNTPNPRRIQVMSAPMATSAAIAADSPISTPSPGTPPIIDHRIERIERLQHQAAPMRDLGMGKKRSSGESQYSLPSAEDTEDKHGDGAEMVHGMDSLSVVSMEGEEVRVDLSVPGIERERESGREREVGKEREKIGKGFKAGERGERERRWSGASMTTVTFGSAE
jgi:hypothetical protein